MKAIDLIWEQKGHDTIRDYYINIEENDIYSRNTDIIKHNFSFIKKTVHVESVIN